MTVTDWWHCHMTVTDQWVTFNSHWLVTVTLDSHWLVTMTLDSHWLVTMSLDSHRLVTMTLDSHWLVTMTLDSHWLVNTDTWQSLTVKCHYPTLSPKPSVQFMVQPIGGAATLHRVTPVECVPVVWQAQQLSRHCRWRLLSVLWHQRKITECLISYLLFWANKSHFRNSVSLPNINCMVKQSGEIKIARVWSTCVPGPLMVTGSAPFSYLHMTDW